MQISTLWYIELRLGTSKNIHAFEPDFSRLEKGATRGTETSDNRSDMVYYGTCGGESVFSVCSVNCILLLGGMALRSTLQWSPKMFSMDLCEGMSPNNRDYHVVQPNLASRGSSAVGWAQQPTECCYICILSKNSCVRHSFSSRKTLIDL